MARSMSQMGHQLYSGGIRARSAHPRTTDMQRLLQHVGFVPRGDIGDSRGGRRQ